MEKDTAVLENIAERRSIRAFDKRVPTPAEVSELINAALEAPTARNLQSNEVIFVRNPELVRRMQDEADRYLKRLVPDRPDDARCFYNAPLLVYLAGDPQNAFSEIDAGITVENIALAAEAIGLGSCIIGCVRPFFRDRESLNLRADLGVSEDRVFEIAMAIGYPQEAPEAKPRDKSKVRVID